MLYTLIILLLSPSGELSSFSKDFKTKLDCEYSKTYASVTFERDEKKLEELGFTIKKYCAKKI